jgi:hypothetical protein
MVNLWHPVIRLKRRYLFRTQPGARTILFHPTNLPCVIDRSRIEKEEDKNDLTRDFFLWTDGTERLEW